MKISITEELKYHIPNRKNGTATVQVACALLFSLFAFFWLFWFQSDVLAVAQHVLSHGATTYNRAVGSLIITLLLLLLQRGVFSMVRLRHYTHALTYLPSLLLLAIISDISPEIGRQPAFSGYWCWAVPVILVVWGISVWLSKQMMPFGSARRRTSLTARRLWVNTLLMCAMMLGVAAVGNTNIVFHHRTHVEVALSQGHADKAAAVGRQSLETDVNLTMLRVFALSRQGLLAEQLFQYPIAGRSADMLPVAGSSSRLLLLSPDSLWRQLGARPARGMDAQRYLRALLRDTLATPAAADYLLCGRLIDRDIDGFVALLPTYYHINDSLPRHYREALTLYTHQRAHPALVYHHPVMDEDWRNLQELTRRYKARAERRQKVFDRYRDTYWYYYFYERAS